MSGVKVGVLGLQGAVPEHLRTLEKLGVEAVRVQWPAQLQDLDGLILPGGESTTISLLLNHWGFVPALQKYVARGGALYGTCAGMILMASEILDGKPDQLKLGAIPMAVRRNGFGRQVDSCEVPLAMPAVGEAPIHTVFIRAPYVVSVEPGVEVLATHQDKIVAVRYGKHLATAFHPELTDDVRVHKLFVERLQAPAGV
jgi:5'-phosphate synthase pdxT subunit